MNRAERKITDAFNKAAEYYKGGLGPNDAIAKAANDEQLNADMTRRVVELFNIKNTNSTLRQLQDKTASFPMAEVDVILDKVFKTPLSGEPKTASLQEEKAVFPNSGSGLRIIRTSDTPKTASEQPATFIPAETIGDWIKQAKGLEIEWNHKLGELNLDAKGAEMKAGRVLGEIVDHFSSSAGIGKWAQFEGEILSEYGEPARSTLDLIHNLSAFKEARFTGNPKLGTHRFHRTSVHNLFDRLVEHQNAFVAASLEHTKLASEYGEKLGEITGLILQTQGIKTAEEKEGSAADLIDFNFARTKKHALLGMEDAIKSAPAEIVAAPGNAVSSALGGVFGKAHENAIEQHYKAPKDQEDMELDNARRQAILADLMNNDEILSGQDPNHIQSAYNVLLHLSPDATLNAGVTQSVLRSALAQQTMDPFTASQISTLQKTMLQNKALTKNLTGGKVQVA